MHWWGPFPLEKLLKVFCMVKLRSHLQSNEIVSFDDSCKCIPNSYFPLSQSLAHGGTNIVVSLADGEEALYEQIIAHTI